MLRRLVGIVMLLLGLAGIVISVAGVYYGRQVVDTAFAGLDNTLALASQGLDTAVSSLDLAKVTLADVNDGLDTVETAAINIAKTVTDTRPLLDQVSVVVSDNAPTSIEAMQSAIPALVEVAANIDQTLITLSRFRIDEEIFGVDIEYDLGIRYNPEVSFDEAFTELGSALEGLPQELRSVEDNLVVANTNLAAISDSITAISGDIETINGRIAEVPAQVDDYIDIITQIEDTVSQVREQVTQRQVQVKMVLTFVLVWWGMPQLALVMIGWDFLFGRRGATAAEIVEDVLEEIEEETEESSPNVAAESDQNDEGVADPE